jgi:hypothetical protein
LSPANKALDKRNRYGNVAPPPKEAILFPISSVSSSPYLKPLFTPIHLDQPHKKLNSKKSKKKRQEDEEREVAWNT